MSTYNVQTTIDASEVADALWHLLYFTLSVIGLLISIWLIWAFISQSKKPARADIELRTYRQTADADAEAASASSTSSGSLSSLSS